MRPPRRRYEDLLFREEELVGQLCECAGGTVTPGTYKHVEGSAKAGVGHNLGMFSSDRESSLRRYSSIKKREGPNAWSAEQLEWIEERLDWELMESLGYKGSVGLNATEATRRLIEQLS